MHMRMRMKLKFIFYTNISQMTFYKYNLDEIIRTNIFRMVKQIFDYFLFLYYHCKSIANFLLVV